MDTLLIWLWGIQIFAAAVRGEFLDVLPEDSLQSFAEKETVLPCRYQPANESVVVQVTWLKTASDSSKEQIMTAHMNDGQTAFGSWSQRVRFKSGEPLMDSSLVILDTEVSDEGTYICEVATFPFGNFEISLDLTVWTIPISSVEPVVVVEGQPFQPVAQCRSIGRPMPQLNWDTELEGQSTNRLSDKEKVTISFSLYPLRGMNGKKLDCLVSHPAFSEPRRLSNKLEVLFPPHVEVSGFNEKWHVGMENAVLRCLSGGNPEPHKFTWTREGGELPKGVTAQPDGSLVFSRPLNYTDEGTYQCVAENVVGKAKADAVIHLADASQIKEPIDKMMMFMIGGGLLGLLVLMVILTIVLVCCHKRKNKKLKKQLTEKKSEIGTLSRQLSMRRVNSYSTDKEGIEENIPLKVEGTLRTSLSSLGADQTHYRDSRSTISGGRGGGAYDSLGRPILYNGSRRVRDRLMDRDEDRLLRVESFVRSSNLSLQESRYQSALVPSPFPTLHSTEILRHGNGSLVNRSSRQGSVTKGYLPPPMSQSGYPVVMDEDEVDEGLGGLASQEHPDDQVSVASSSHVSMALSIQSPKLRMALPHLENPHASLIHKAQIV